MGFIKDFFWGKKIKINDDKIGELTARIKNKDISVNYTWTGEHKLDGQKKETFFILEGNSLGPYKEQLISVHRIVDTINDIITQLNKEFKNKQTIREKFKGDWAREYYLAAITSYNTRKNIISGMFEITIEFLDDDAYAIFIWNGDMITEIIAK